MHKIWRDMLLAFPDHKMINLALNRRSSWLYFLAFQIEDSENGEARAFVMIRFWLPSRSWHVSAVSESSQIDQWVLHASRPSTGWRRKPQVLPRVYYYPELLAWIRDHQVPFWTATIWDHPLRMLNSSEVVPLFGGPNFQDEEPPWKLSLVSVKLSNTIPKLWILLWWQIIPIFQML